MNQFTRNLTLWAVIALAMVMLFNMFQQPQLSNQRIAYSEFLQKLDSGELTEVTIQGHTLTGKSLEGKPIQTYAPQDAGLINRLLEKKVEIKVEPPEDQPWYMTLLVSWFPMLLLIGVWIFFMRQMQGGGGKAMSFGRSRARLLNQESGRVTFEDVAGVDEAKEELSEVVEFLANPKKFTRLGGRIPKGVLLVGPPGTGKTLLARAVAGEAGVPFFSISGSDFVEMFVGVGASRVRDLFTQGKKNAPCLIFIDEIDAVGRQRGAGLGGGHDEREQTLNQLLVEMDGFESNEGVILIAATNRPDVLDPALLRPGRFDRQVVVPTPDLRGRRRILEVHSRRTPLGDDVNLDILARSTPGFSGADIENLVNEAALQAAKLDKDKVNMTDFEYAKDKVLMGKERRSLILSDDEKRITAYHEGGHALAAVKLPKTDPIHKVTIIPRGRALGLTMQLPEEDRHGYSRSYLLNTLVVLLGGRVAEELVFDDITTGAGNDIERATKMARKMVCEWGMSDSIGPLAVGETGEEVFIGREWVQNKNFSEDTARLVDIEVKKIVMEARARCRKLLEENRKYLDAIAEALLERETISGDDIALLLQEKPLPPLEVPLVKSNTDDSPPSSTKGTGGFPSALDGEQDSFLLEPDTKTDLAPSTTPETMADAAPAADAQDTGPAADSAASAPASVADASAPDASSSGSAAHDDSENKKL